MAAATAPPHEKKIIYLLQRGDRKGVPLLYEHYSAAVYGIVIRMVKNDDIAKEVMQDVFVKAWKHADKYDSKKGRLYTWIAQIARNCCLTTIRSGNFQRDSKTDSLDPSVYDSEGMSTESKIQDSGLATVLSKLDDKHKILIDYIYYRGYSQREAAEALSLPVGTVKTRIRTALLELRRVLGHDISVISIVFAMLLERFI